MKLELREQGEKWKGEGPFFNDNTGFFVSFYRGQQHLAYLQLKEYPTKVAPQPRRYQRAGSAEFRSLSDARKAAAIVNKRTAPRRSAKV